MVRQPVSLGNMEFLTVLQFLIPGFDRVTLLAVFCTVFALVFDFMKRRQKCINYPPGPWTLPFIGSVFHVSNDNPYTSFEKLRGKYGNTFSLQFGWTDVVVLNGYETIKDGLVKKSEDTSDRPNIPVFQKYLCAFGQGIVLAKYGQWWRDHRRFALSTLKNFGLGKKSLELRIVEEASFLNNELEAEIGHPFDPHLRINNAASNVICSLMFGDRFDYQDKKFLQLLEIIEESMVLEAGFWAKLVNMFPFIHGLPGPHRRIPEIQKKVAEFLQEIIAEHKEVWDPNEPRDFIDAFLVECEKMKASPNTSFTEKSLVYTSLDLFVAGTETTSTTLHWGLLFMVLFPDIQKKVQEEIDRVIGTERKPALGDQGTMAFTNAVIHETQRFGSIVPNSVPHETSRDTEIMGFSIPKGTMVIPNLSSALYDPKFWAKPHEFNPGHFLDDSGRLVKPEAFIPFSAGPRVCLGEQMAKMELFLFFTSLLQRFIFFLPENEPKPSYTRTKCGITRSPMPFQLCVRLR
ncbi:cytochrome P450 2D15-like [Callorhinchus milii]|uniref:cytochrome P450 2D15-like n=1 Tax=Callorhinchus milii TaxID=7868 RepID=UPI001C3FF39A|nr:cytochrome P450 2D15-like [Callorhinchus milii]